MSARPSLASVISEFLATEPAGVIGPKELVKLRRAVVQARGRTPPDAALVDRLISAGANVARPLGGIPPGLAERVRTRSLAEAADSLEEMAAIYSQAREAGDAIAQADCRRAVMRGKERVKLTLGRKNLSVEKREEKREILAWYLSWLENPGLFPDWLAVRRAGSAAGPHPAGSP